MHIMHHEEMCFHCYTEPHLRLFQSLCIETVQKNKSSGVSQTTSHLMGEVSMLHYTMKYRSFLFFFHFYVTEKVLLSEAGHRDRVSRSTPAIVGKRSEVTGQSVVAVNSCVNMGENGIQKTFAFKLNKIFIPQSYTKTTA